MPVLRSVTEWRTRDGKRRRVRLFNAWQNMRGRCSGRLHAGNGARPWKGLRVHWRSFREFRAWSLANGYSRTTCSLDRERVAEGYGPHNCEWVTVAENSRRMRFYQGHTTAPDPDVPF